MPTVQGRTKGFPRGQSEWDGTRVNSQYTDSFDVLADNDTQGPRTIMLALQVFVGQSFFDDQFARATKIGPAIRDESARRKWTVPVFYTTQFPKDDADDADKPPNLRRLKRRWSSETIHVPFTEDALTGAEVVNSVGVPIELTTDFSIPVLTVTKYVQNFDPNQILNYENHVNNSAFYGAPKKSALLASIDAEEDAGEVYQGIMYDRVQYVIKFKIPITEDNKGWVERLFNSGTFYFDGGDSTKDTPFLTKEKPKTPRVGKLDTNGDALPDGQPPIVLEFNKHKLANFDALSIGLND